MMKSICIWKVSPPGALLWKCKTIKKCYCFLYLSSLHHSTCKWTIKKIRKEYETLKKSYYGLEFFVFGSKNWNKNKTEEDQTMFQSLGVQPYPPFFPKVYNVQASSCHFLPCSHLVEPKVTFTQPARDREFWKFFKRACPSTLFSAQQISEGKFSLL